MRYVHTEDGHRLAVTELEDPLGSGGAREDPVLLVHGFAQNRLAFALGHLPRALVDKGARVFLGELRGHGLSRAAVPEAALARQEWGLDTHLHQDLPALTRHVLEHTGADRLHFMGHSMGGILGYAALAADPPFRSLTGWAAPILLGAGQPIVHAAAWLVPPLMRAGRPARVPMDRLLGGLAGVLSEPDATGPKRWFQRLAGLAR